MKYTPDEVAKLLANRPNQPHYVKALIGKCVNAAVLAEREACAYVAEWEPCITHTPQRIAAAIRARGNQ